MLNKVFHFDTPREPYIADAAVVWCFDHRFHLAFAKFLKRSGVLTADVIKVAGGAKALAAPAGDANREFVVEQIRTSVRLHGTKRIILMLHSDCGAYGGLSAFQNDAAAEAEHHEAELARAARTVTELLPGIEVRAYFVDFDGISQMTPATG